MKSSPVWRLRAGMSRSEDRWRWHLEPSKSLLFVLLPCTEKLRDDDRWAKRAGTDSDAPVPQVLSVQARKIEFIGWGVTSLVGYRDARFVLVGYVLPGQVVNSVVLLAEISVGASVIMTMGALTHQLGRGL